MSNEYVQGTLELTRAFDGWWLPQRPLHIFVAHSSHPIAHLCIAQACAEPSQMVQPSEASAVPSR
uniref:hypothetical protein n=1 Tax=Bifidobacterium longum TaxID=216816 RepID=UPI001F2E5D04